MTNKDYCGAASALFDWLESQKIKPEDSARVLTTALVAIIVGLAKQNGRSAEEGGRVIAEIIVESLK